MILVFFCPCIWFITFIPYIYFKKKEGSPHGGNDANILLSVQIEA
jgi:hypothetical protein